MTSSHAKKSSHAAFLKATIYIISVYTLAIIGLITGSIKAVAKNIRDLVDLGLELSEKVQVNRPSLSLKSTAVVLFLVPLICEDSHPMVGWLATGLSAKFRNVPCIRAHRVKLVHELGTADAGSHTDCKQPRIMMVPNNLTAMTIECLSTRSSASC